MAYTVPVIPYEAYEESVAFIQSQTKHESPSIGIICGSGLGALADQLEEKDEIDYKLIPHFMTSTAMGHKGCLVIGKLSGKTIICMQGRLHPYEGYSMQHVALPVRVMHMLGVEQLVITNAAGGMNSNFRMGDFMLIRDHIYLAGLVGMNPLVGPNDDRFGFRFPNISSVYDEGLRKIAHEVAEKQGFAENLRCGVYCMIFGPMFATDAETAYVKDTLHADAIGMSTCPEVVAAAQLQMKVLGISVITDCIAEYAETGPVNHELVLAQSAKSAARLVGYVREIVDKM